LVWPPHKIKAGVLKFLKIKILFILLLCAAMTLLSGCVGDLLNPTPNVFALGFESQAKVRRGGAELNVSVCGDSAGGCKIEVADGPLPGLCYTFAQDGLTIRYNGHEKAINPDVLPIGNFAAGFFRAVQDTAKSAEPMKKADDDTVTLSGICERGAYQFTLDERSGMPLRFEMPETGIEMDFIVNDSVPAKLAGD